MVFVTIKVIGLNECKAALNKVKTDIPLTNKLILERVTSLFIREAKSNAHVITGNMKRKIGASEINPQQGTAIVEAGAEYSYYENDRGPDHDFMDRAYKTTKEQSTAIVKSLMDSSLRKSGVPLK